MKLKQKKHIYDVKYFIILLIIAFIIGLAVTIQKTKNTRPVSIQNQKIIVQPTSEPDPYAGKRIVEKFPNENILWYHVTLQTDNLSNGVNSNPPLLVSYILPDLFDLPMVKIGGGAVNVIEKVVYNTKTGYPYQGESKEGAMYRQYNSDFYIAIKGFSLDVTKTYKNSYAQATLSFVNPQIIPYLENKDYCQQDSDCVIRNSFCGYGSFNEYEYYADIYGCESPPYDLELLNPTGQPIFFDGQEYDQTLKCYVKASYSGSACIKNQCKGTGRTLSCINR